jgi:DNA-binding transcriptional regulator Cro
MLLIVQVDQIISHYGSPTKAKDALGYTLQTFRNWRKSGIPLRAQQAIQAVTKGKLKADNGEKHG